MPTIAPDDLIGRTFLTPPDKHGNRYRAWIARKIIDVSPENEPLEDPSYSNVRFILAIDDKTTDEIIGYNEVIDQYNREIEDEFDDNGEKLWKFRSIRGHQGPLKKGDINYKGSTWNVQVEWETGEITYEPLNQMAKDDPITCAIYARDNDLLNTEGWRQFKKRAQKTKRMIREIRQAKLRQTRRATKYMFGVQIPKDYREALALDERNGNTKWQDATKLELAQLDEYNTFED
jgi:hypothetical protein